MADRRVGTIVPTHKTHLIVGNDSAVAHATGLVGGDLSPKHGETALVRD